MSVINSIMSWLMKKRIHQIELFMKYPQDVQNEWLLKLVEAAKYTEWGGSHKFHNIRNYEDFKNQVPVQDYESLKPFIERQMKGEQNLLWPSEINWFAKSSGTTSDKSKFIPVSQESLEECHYKGGKDMLSLYCHNNPETQLFTGKNLALGGSLKLNVLRRDGTESYAGDLSAIIMQNLPVWAEFYRTPNLSIALMDEWESKIEKLTETSTQEDVVSLSGVPSWMLILVKHILEKTGKQNLLEVWPHLELFFHGGVSFTPYREQFKKLIPSDQMHYVETYNASEGFFGIQDRLGERDMLLMLDYGIFYEFMEMDEYGQTGKKVVALDGVEQGKVYAMLISTNAGLWRYQIGDTVRFTSVAPYRIQIAGRTKHFINAFGEELMIDNAEKALRIACEKTGAVINEYSAAPHFMDNNSKAVHEWLIEFEKEPDDLAYFTEVLDNALKSLNSDYEAKRYHNLLLQPPKIILGKKNVFYHWLQSKNKLGGQYKVPRLSNDRKNLDEMLKFNL